MMLYNIHTHTEFSHDSTEKIDNICAQAMRQGLFGFAVTDHLDCEYYENPIVEKNIDASFEAAVHAKQNYRGQILVSAGVEVGDALFAKDFAQRMIEKHPWDVILLSVHAVRMKNWEMPFSTIDFSDKSDVFIREYLTTYFNDLTESVNTFDYDVCSHLTVPLRYIVKKFEKAVDITDYYPQIKRILQTVITDGKALEINTSGWSGSDSFLMPDKEIIALYRELGGRKITLGSDAHTAERVGNGLHETAALLKGMGFDSAVYYSHRKETEYFIGGTR